MQYDISKEKSAEYLRQAIQHMSMQEAAFHPVSYALWYEYSSGEHARLIEEVDALIEREKKLNEKNTHQLFQKHIASPDAAAAKQIIDRVDQVVAGVSNTTEKAGVDASRFRKTLAAWSGKIQHLDSELSRQVEGLVSGTLDMEQSLQALQQTLHLSLQEIAELKNEIVKARQEAMLDGLTGLMNRKTFDTALSHCLEAMPAQDSFLIIADIDFFKRINDNYGHVFGDKVIQAVGNIIKKTCSDLNVAGRYGGEEFILLLQHTSLEIAREIAESIRQQVASINIKNAVTQRWISNITLSLGIAAYQTGDTTDSLISRADQALYTAKAMGRNQVTVQSTQRAAA